MARIAGVDLPRNKRGFIALTYIYGVGRSRAKEILDKAGVDGSIKVKDWTDEQIAKIREVIKDYTVEGALKVQVRLDRERLIKINCYRGIRHRIGLPVRGQRTRTNARTVKGKRKTVANKKKAPRK